MPHDPRWRPDRSWRDDRGPPSNPRPQSGSSFEDFERFEWRESGRTPSFFGTGEHFGGGYGTAPGTRASGAGNLGATGYGRQGAWSDSESWTPDAQQSSEKTDLEAPSYRGRGPKGYERTDQRFAGDHLRTPD